MALAVLQVCPAAALVPVAGVVDGAGLFYCGSS